MAYLLLAAHLELLARQLHLYYHVPDSYQCLFQVQQMVYLLLVAHLELLARQLHLYYLQLLPYQIPYQVL